MTGRPNVSVAALLIQLCRVRRHGARAALLLLNASTFLELLYPPSVYPGLHPADRARRAENLLRRATDLVGGDGGRALVVLLGLQPGLSRTTLTHRRTVAGKIFGVQAETFRRPYLEGTLLFDLAFELSRLVDAGLH